IVDRSAVGDHHQDPPLLRTGHQTLVRPQESLAVDILLEETFAHHEAEIAAGVAVRLVSALVDDVPEVVEPARVRRTPRSKPCFAALPAFPGAGREPEDFA